MPDFCMNFQSLRFALISAMVSGRNSSGNLALRFAGMIFCAALSVTERIVEARSSDDNVSGFVSPSADETSC